MASNEGVENRPFPYLTVDADLLSNLRQSAAEGLFHSFDLLVGKDAREAGIKFEVLLGVYTNAIQYVRFLETALAKRHLLEPPSSWTGPRTWAPGFLSTCEAVSLRW